jgi:hypothetical protein
MLLQIGVRPLVVVTAGGFSEQQQVSVGDYIAREIDEGVLSPPPLKQI